METWTQSPMNGGEILLIFKGALLFIMIYIKMWIIRTKMHKEKTYLLSYFLKGWCVFNIFHWIIKYILFISLIWFFIGIN